MKRIWIVRRLKNIGCNDEDLVKIDIIMIMLIRSILETSCPVFHPQLTNENQDDIERVQKTVCRIILGDKFDCWTYPDYHIACRMLRLTSLDAWSLASNAREVKNTEICFRELSSTMAIRQEENYFPLLS